MQTKIVTMQYLNAVAAALAPAVARRLPASPRPHVALQVRPEEWVEIPPQQNERHVGSSRFFEVAGVDFQLTVRVPDDDEALPLPEVPALPAEVQRGRVITMPFPRVAQLSDLRPGDEITVCAHCRLRGTQTLLRIPDNGIGEALDDEHGKGHLVLPSCPDCCTALQAGGVALQLTDHSRAELAQTQAVVFESAVRMGIEPTRGTC